MHAKRKSNDGGVKPSSRAILALSLILNVILIIVVAAAGVYKFTGIRYVLGGGGYSYESNNWYEPFVSQARNLSKVDRCDIALVGDSLTMYGLWDEMLPGVQVVNRGIGSDVSEGVLNRIDTVTKTNPDKVFLMIGTNDIACMVDPEVTVQNVDLILSKLEEELPQAEIFLESVLPRTGKYARQVEDLNSMYESICEDHDGVQFLNLYPLYCDSEGIPNGALFASDGYHLSGEGYQVWVDFIKDFI